MLKCERCRSLGHTVDTCRAKRDIFSGALLVAPPVTTKQVYVIECADNCYYVGSSLNVKERFMAHCSGTACEWTKRHAPIRLLPTTYTSAALYAGNPYGCQEQDEFYACVYNLGGIDHVRGWLYHNADLVAHERRALENQVAAHFDLCWKCGYRSHISGDCVATTQAAWRHGQTYLAPKEIAFNE